VDYLEIDAGGVPAMRAVPHAAGDDRVLLCLHGGGFVGGSMYSHRKLFGHLAKSVGAVSVFRIRTQSRAWTTARSRPRWLQMS
jgi:acetyl esterase/lipase